MTAKVVHFVLESPFPILCFYPGKMLAKLILEPPVYSYGLEEEELSIIDITTQNLQGNGQII